MNVRFANVNDFDGISVIQTQVHDLHNGYRPDLYKKVNNALDKTYFINMIEKECIIIAKDGKQTVGYCIFTFKEHKETAISFGRKVLFIDAIGVLEDHKRNGIGGALFSFVKKVAKDNNCDTIKLGVYIENKNAIEFYEAMGMGKKNIIMDYRCYG